jgi:hypothetical protein
LDEQSKPFWQQPEGERDPRDIRTASYALREISKQLSRAKENSDDISDLLKPQERTLIDDFSQLSLCEPDAREAGSVLERLKSRYQSGLQTTPEAVNCSQWALYEPKRLKKLLDAIDEHVQVLETLFPHQLHTLAAQEAVDLEFEATQALEPVIQKRDPILASALEDALPMGSSWEGGVVVMDNASVHFGNNYWGVSHDKGQFFMSGPPLWGDPVFHDGYTYR